MRSTVVAWVWLATSFGALAEAQAAGAAASATGAQPALHELRLVDGLLPAEQRLITALQGDTLRLRASSNTAGELHLHAYRLSLALQPGQPAELAFTAHATGRFRFEWHAAKTPGAAPGPVPPADHHGPPLAVLEVRPR
jgi:hypothetical protein